MSVDTPILVTGAGGPAGIAVIRALLERDHRVVGVDVDPLGAGLRLAGEGFTVPRYDDPSYVEELCRIADKTGSTVLLSTLAEEVAHLERGAEALDGAGLAHWLPAATAIERCIDKWQFWLLAREYEIPVPDTALGQTDGVPGPWVVKPRFGRGSRDVFVVHRESEVGSALARVDQPIVQTLVHGREFTVDVLADRAGHVRGAVPRWRIETRGGISVKGETFSSAPLRELIEQLVRAAGLQGPLNIQGFVDGDDIRFIEVNPRFSGALPLSLAAGCDIVGEYLRGIAGDPIRDDRLRHRDGVRMTRYFAEVFEG